MERRVMESYEDISRRHERELKEWCRKVLEGKKSITSAAKSVKANPGTFWRLARRLGVIE